MSPLQPWHDFFLLTGGASATLLGLVFVAASIAATVPNEKLGDDKTRALWVQPIVWAFVRVLLVSAMCLIPLWQLKNLGLVLLGASIGDLSRMAWVFKGLLKHHRTRERLNFGDWRWYLVLPTLATALVATNAAALALGLAWPLGLIAGGLLLHLAVGIHNAWELTDWLTTLQG